MLNVVHISTFDNGGAGNAALRLHLGLLETEINSTFLCLRKTTHHKNVVAFSQRNKLSQSVFIRAPFNLIGLPINKTTRNTNQLKRLSGKYEMFTFPDTDTDILQHPAVVNADIVHLHWVGKYLDYSFFPRINKPVIWTLHDMNPILGGFHYHDDVALNIDQFAALENKLRIKKERLINACKNLTVAAPSKWLFNLASSSPAFKSAKHLHIPYGIDTALFKDYGATVSRKVFDLPEDKVIISFVSHDLKNRRKGFDLLFDAISQMKEKKNVIFFAAGFSAETIAGNNIVYAGNINDERLMALLYSASDGFVLPSREDNLPNTMLEAMSCGTPVLSFAVGGMLDIIQPDFNGDFAPEVSSAALAHSLDLFVANIKNYDRKKIREHIIAKYPLSLQAGSYMNLYTNVKAGK